MVKVGDTVFRVAICIQLDKMAHGVGGFILEMGGGQKLRGKLTKKSIIWPLVGKLAEVAKMLKT